MKDLMLPKNKLRLQFDVIVDEAESYYSSDLIFNTLHGFYDDLFIQNKIVGPEEIYEKIRYVESILKAIDKNKYPKDVEVLKKTIDFLKYWNGNLKVSVKFDWYINLN